MPFNFEARPSDSPFVESIWHTETGDVESFLSLAVSQFVLVVMRQKGRTIVTLRGPETRVTTVECPEDAEFLGIQFKLGAFLPPFPSRTLVDGLLDLPDASVSSFRLDGSTWQYPTYENADTFLARLARQGLLVSDPVVEALLQGRPTDVSPRTVQRRFLQATGLTHETIRQIERARRAATLLKQGRSIAETVELTGYADQPHLTRSLKRLIGQTPAQMIHRPEATSRL